MFVYNLNRIKENCCRRLENDRRTALVQKQQNEYWNVSVRVFSIKAVGVHWICDECEQVRETVHAPILTHRIKQSNDLHKTNANRCFIVQFKSLFFSENDVCFNGNFQERLSWFVIKTYFDECNELCLQLTRQNKTFVKGLNCPDEQFNVAHVYLSLNNRAAEANHWSTDFNRTINRTAPDLMTKSS